MVNAVAENLLHIVAKELHHARVRQAHRGFDPGTLGKLAAGDGSVAAVGTRAEIPLNVEVTRVGQRTLVDLTDAEAARDAEKGIHGALGVGGYKHQAAPRLARTAGVLAVAADAGGLQIGEKEPARFVVCDFAGIVS